MSADRRAKKVERLAVHATAGFIVAGILAGWWYGIGNLETAIPRPFLRAHASEYVLLDPLLLGHSGIRISNTSSRECGAHGDLRLACNTFRSSSAVPLGACDAFPRCLTQI